MPRQRERGDTGRNIQEGVLRAMNLVILLTGHPPAGGVTLDQMREAIGGEKGPCNRRTAERYRETLISIFGGALEYTQVGRSRHWRLDLTSATRSLVRFQDGDEEDIAKAAALIEGRRSPGLADSLRRIAGTVRAVRLASDRKAFDPELDWLVAMDVPAARPGIRVEFPKGHMARLRNAVSDHEKLRITYRSRSTGKTSTQLVEPYGFLWGDQGRVYLVAYMVEWSEDWRAFDLTRIIDIEDTDSYFSPDSEFDLRVWASESFGIFREEDGPFKIEWIFDASVAADAATYIFHPTQKLTKLKDGRLRVRFTAYGLREMAWHLATWGNLVEVVRPRALQNAMKERGHGIIGISNIK